VEVLFANPAPGFTVEIEPGNDNGVKVEFDSDSHTSRVDAWWDGGPADRVREDPGFELDLDFRSGTRRVQVDVEFEDGVIRERVRIRDTADDSRTEITNAS
jgi:hypothetical protein